MAMEPAMEPAKKSPKKSATRATKKSATRSATATPRLRTAPGKTETEIAARVVKAAQEVMAIGSNLGEIVDRLPLASQVQLAAALDLMGIAVTAMYACVDEGCDVGGLKLSPIESRPGPNRDLILKCRHKPPHCWDRTGKNIACP